MTSSSEGVSAFSWQVATTQKARWVGWLPLANYFLGAVKSFLESLMGSPCPTGDLGHLGNFTVADLPVVRARRLAFCL